MNNPSWDLFEGIPPKEVEALLTQASPMLLSQGDELFGLGAEAKGVYLVVHGRMKLTLPLSVGDKQVDILVGERLPRHMLGWSGLIPPHRFTVKAIAAAETELLILGRASVLAYFENRPDVGYAVYSNLARIVGQRLQVFQTMWIREMQHVVKSKTA